MSERQLPPALEKKWKQSIEQHLPVYAPSVSDLFEFIYGKDEMVMSELLHYVKHTPDIVERVRQRVADNLDYDAAGTNILTGAWMEALRQELGMDGPMEREK